MPPRSRPSRVVLALAAAASLSACSADDLDCSLGAMKPTCPPGTAGFDRMAARLRLAQRTCLSRGLETGSDAYAACLLAQNPPRPPARVTPFDRMGPPTP